MKVLHTVDSLHVRHGGPSRSITALCDSLSAYELDVHLAARRDGGRGELILPGHGVDTHLHEATIIGTHRARRQSILGLKADAGVVHDHGLWLPSNIITALAARRIDMPFIVSPRGMLTPWSLEQGGTKKQLAWKLYQRRILERAAVLHATADSEADGFRNLGLRAPIAIIPNGVVIPDRPRDTVENIRPQRILFLSRIHPGKGLENLLRAWSTVRPTGWEILIAGPDEDGHRGTLEVLSKQLGVEDSVRFHGPVDDAKKWELYGSAQLFVLPTHSENFGIVVAEAMAAGLPVITTKGAPWAVLEKINNEIGYEEK